MVEKLKKAKMIIGFLVGLIQGVIELIKVIENEEPEDDEKRGAQKKKYVIELVLIIYDIVEEVVGELPLKRDTVESFLDKAIDVLVTIMNVFNIFRKPKGN